MISILFGDYNTRINRSRTSRHHFLAPKSVTEDWNGEKLSHLRKCGQPHAAPIARW